MTPEELDHNRIYAKTVAGEEAMQQRTLVVQRNLRMVLILVDGNATVAELCNKTNQPELTCSALCELENDGFIEARVEKESVWSPERQRAREEGLALADFSEFSSFGGNNSPISTSPPAQRLMPPVGDAQGASTGILSGASLGVLSNSPPSFSDRSAPLSAFDSGTVFLSKAEATSINDLPPAASESSMLENFSFFSKRGLEKKGPDLKPIKRQPPRWYLSWPAVLPFGALFLLLLLALVALFFPYAHYLPAMEAAIARTTGQAVKIGGMHLTFYPRPGLLLNDVQFGTPSEPGLVVGELRMQPALSSLWQPQLVLSSLELRAWTFSVQSVEQLTATLAATADKIEKPLIEQILFEKTGIVFAGLGITDLHGQARLTASGTLQSLSLSSADRRLQIDVSPEANGLAVKMQALDWKPAQDSPFLFSALNLQGHLRGRRLSLDNVDCRIFDGTASGSASLTDQQRAGLTGELSFERINLGKFGEALGIGSQFQGNASGKMRFSATVQEATSLASSLNSDGSFTITRGNLLNIDLGEAVRRNSSKPIPLGGMTRFDRLSGTFHLAPMAYRFAQLSLTAGLLQGNGYLNVNRSQQVNGLITVAIGRNQAPLPIAIGRTLAAPLLHMASPAAETRNAGAQNEKP